MRLLNYVSERECLIIHIVGANSSGEVILIAWEVLLHLTDSIVIGDYNDRTGINTKILFVIPLQQLCVTREKYFVAVSQCINTRTT